MLAYQWQAATGIPVVFLHGLLGSQEDWKGIFNLLRKFPEIRPLAIDLPYHNQSANIACQSIETCRTLLHRTLQKAIGTHPFYLVGYSLGGRLALDYTINQPSSSLQGVILEGANIGLQTDKARADRWQNDLKWANRFENEPLDIVLNAWYQQAVFSDLTTTQRLEFIQKRQHNNGKKIAQMLRATSLAKQPFFSLSPTSTKDHLASPNIIFFIGEQDQKFRQLAEQHQLHHQLIPHAGHNAHQANPQAFVEALLQFIRR